VTAPAVAPFTVTEHVPPAERAHVVPELNVTLPVPACDQVIVSPLTLPEKPVTVAVHEVPAHDAVVVVVALLTEKANVPELP